MICVITRTRKSHIVNFKLGKGRFRTLCQKTFSKRTYICVFATDNIDVSCDECKDIHTRINCYNSFSSYEAHTLLEQKLISRMISKISFHRKNYWRKLVGYKNLLNRQQ
jgi:hypothetical protein